MEKEIKRMEEHIEELKPIYGDRLAVCTLQGSQNYGTDTELSDVDTKLCVYPTIEDLIRGQEIHMDATLKNGEKCSIKYPMEFIKLFFKGNVNNLEMLYTSYVVNQGFIEEYVRPVRDDIVFAVKGTMLRACIGMMHQKKSSLFKGTATTKEFVQNNGYDSKDIIHIIRLYHLIKNYATTGDFSQALHVPHNIKVEMSEYREGNVSKKFVEDYADSTIKLAEVVRSEANLEDDTDKICQLKQDIQDQYVSWWKNQYGFKI